MRRPAHEFLTIRLSCGGILNLKNYSDPQSAEHSHGGSYTRLMIGEFARGVLSLEVERMPKDLDKGVQGI